MPERKVKLTAAEAIAAETALKDRRYDRKVDSLKDQISMLERALEEATSRANLVEGVRDLSKQIKIETSVKAGRLLNPQRRETTAVAIASDWHWFEDVDPAKV